MDEQHDGATPFADDLAAHVLWVTLTDRGHDADEVQRRIEQARETLDLWEPFGRTVDRLAVDVLGITPEPEQ